MGVRGLVGKRSNANDDVLAKNKGIKSRYW